MRESRYITYKVDENNRNSASKQAKVGLHFLPYQTPELGLQRLEGIEVLRAFNEAFFGISNDIAQKEVTVEKDLIDELDETIIKQPSDWANLVRNIQPNSVINIHIGEKSDSPVTFREIGQYVGYLQRDEDGFLEYENNNKSTPTLAGRAYAALAKEFDAISTLNPWTGQKEQDLSKRYDHLIAQTLLAKFNGNSELLKQIPYSYYEKNYAKLLNEMAVLQFVSEAYRDRSTMQYANRQQTSYSALGIAVMALDLIATQANYGKNAKPFLFKNMFDSIKLTNHNNASGWQVMQTTKTMAGQTYSPTLDAKAVGAFLAFTQRQNRQKGGKVGYTSTRVDKKDTSIVDGEALKQHNVFEMYNTRQAIIQTPTNDKIIKHRLVVKDIALLTHWLENVKPLGEVPTAISKDEMRTKLKDIFKQRLARAYLLEQNMEAALNPANPNIAAQMANVLNMTDIPYLGKLSELERSKLNTLAGKALLQAVQDDNFKLADHLLKLGANPNSQDAEGNTPLHLAINFALKDNFKYVNLLLDYNADARVENIENHLTPRGFIKQKLGEDKPSDTITKLIHDLEAHERLQGSIVKKEPNLLLDHLASVPNIQQQYVNKLFVLDMKENNGQFLNDYLDSLEGKSAKHDWRTVNNLLRKVKDADHNTLLHMAIKQRSENSINNNLLSRLFQQGIDINAQNAERKTALHFACQQGNSEMITLLLDKGAKTAISDAAGKLPLDYFKGDTATAYLLAQKQKEELVKMTPEIDKLQSQTTILTHQLNEAKQQEEQLKKQLDTSISNNQELSENVKTAQLARQTIEEQLAAKTNELTEITRLKTIADTSLAQAQASIKTLEADKLNLKSELAEKDIALSTTQELANKQANELTEAHTKITQLIGKVEETKQQLTSLTAEKQNLQTELIDSQSLNQQLSTNLDEVTSKAKQATERAVQAEEQLKAEQERSNKLDSSLKSKIQALADLEQNNQQLSTQLADSINTNALQGAEIQKLQALLAQLTDTQKTTTTSTATTSTEASPSSSSANTAPTQEASNSPPSSPRQFLQSSFTKITNFFQASPNNTSEQPSSPHETSKRKASSSPSPPHATTGFNQPPQIPSNAHKKQATADNPAKISSLPGLEHISSPSAQSKTPESSPSNSPRGAGSSH